MVRPFAYDFRRTLLSSTVVAVIIITVVLSVAFVPYFRSAESPTGIGSNNLAGVTYYDNSTGVNVLIYSFNQFGQPISGTSLNVTAQSGTTIRNAIASTNSSGYAWTHIDIPYPFQGVNNLSIASGNNGFQMPFPDVSGFPTPLYNPVTLVLDQTNSSQVDVAAFYSAPLGAPPTNYGVYIALNTGGFLNESSMTRLGTMTSYFQVFTLPPGVNITESDTVAVAIFDPSGTPDYGSGFSGFSFVYSNMVQQLSNVQNLASLFVGGLLGLFVPLMAILASYSTYGKDRVSGVLESVLARPVSRRGLSISRFTSTSLAMVVAVGLSVVALDLVVYFVAGFFLTFYFTATIMLALSVEAIAFVGILFVFSRLTKSGGALVGLGVGLWAILELFWSLIIFLVADLLHFGFGSAAYYGLTVYSSFFNPAQFYGLVSSLTSSSISGFSFTPASYGINIYSVTATGILWIVLPFALFLYLATKRD